MFSTYLPRSQGGYFDPRQSILAGMTQAQLQDALQSAQTAYAQLMSGGKVVQASYTQGDGTKSVTYSQTSMASLLNWITILQRALGLGGMSRRPMVPYW